MRAAPIFSPQCSHFVSLNLSLSHVAIVDDDTVVATPFHIQIPISMWYATKTKTFKVDYTNRTNDTDYMFSKNWTGEQNVHKNVDEFEKCKIGKNTEQKARDAHMICSRVMHTILIHISSEYANRREHIVCAMTRTFSILRYTQFIRFDMYINTEQLLDVFFSHSFAMKNSVLYWIR